MNWTKKLLVYEWDDLAIALLLTAGFWLLGEGVGWIAPSVDKTITRILPIGLLVALLAGGMVLFFFSANRFGFEFGWLLQFGVPRRRPSRCDGRAWRLLAADGRQLRQHRVILRYCPETKNAALASARQFFVSPSHTARNGRCHGSPGPPAAP